MTEQDDRFLFVVLLMVFSIIIAIMGSIIGDKSKEIRILKARCIKTGVATMTYDFNTGEEKFIFEVSNNEK